MACVCHTQGRHASYGSWKATSALAKGKYRLGSSGGIPRAQEDLLHSERRRERAACVWKESIVCLLHLECLKFAMRTVARRQAFVDLEEWTGTSLPGHGRLIPRRRRGGPAGVAWASKGVRICAPIDAHAWTWVSHVLAQSKKQSFSFKGAFIERSKHLPYSSLSYQLCAFLTQRPWLWHLRV